MGDYGSINQGFQRWMKKGGVLVGGGELADADETLCDKLPAASDGLLKGKPLTAHETHVSAPKLVSNTRNFMLAPVCTGGTLG